MASNIYSDEVGLKSIFVKTLIEKYPFYFLSDLSIPTHVMNFRKRVENKIETILLRWHNTTYNSKRHVGKTKISANNSVMRAKKDYIIGKILWESRDFSV